MANPNRRLIARVANRLKRELLWVPPVRALRERSYQSQLAQHRARLPPLADEHRDILRGLESLGVHATNLDTFANTYTPRLLAELQTLLPELQALPADGDNAPRLPAGRLYEFPSIARRHPPDRTDTR